MTNLRRIRLQYGIHLTELQRVSGLPNQYISRAELGLIHPTDTLEEQLYDALDEIAAERRSALYALEKALMLRRHRLLEPSGDA